jgi:hypothetical protein
MRAPRWRRWPGRTESCAMSRAATVGAGRAWQAGQRGGPPPGLRPARGHGHGDPASVTGRECGCGHRARAPAPQGEQAPVQ